MFTSYGACKEKKEGRLNKRDREIVCVCMRERVEAEGERKRGKRLQWICRE
jgi:hypothetical protein